ncbi:MAG TPA: aminotransferase class I/II-fold pyridoxal phosphate-dependent enzyme [Firmicutes bacterium]|nr:aminotransferase class I/II-fold pyridoxal phosphate-dependent enzyme [Bacillota bacterium]
MGEKNYKLETQVLHSGYSPDPTTNARAVPVYRTAAYNFKSTEHGANLFALKELGNIYTRLMNPTTDVLEQRAAALDGGIAAVAAASGTAAVHYSVINIARQGDEIVSANNLYGGTYTMFNDILPHHGITTKFVHYNDYEAYDKAVNKNTKAIFVETIGNPLLGVVDISEVSKVAKKHKIPLIVDATFTTPYIMKPIEHGADIVVYSLTKWYSGHGTIIGGAAVDSGKFNWKDEKFPNFNEPEPSYHGLRFAHDLGPLSSLAYALRFRLVPLRNLGACISPDNAWQTIQGIETLPLRMQRHSDNALEAAEFLESHSAVSWVKYPGLESHEDHNTAKKQFKNGFGGMVVFGLKGGYDAAVKFIDNIKLFSNLANVGDAKSLVIHSASTTHSQLTEEQQKAAGITPDLVRLSIGIEHIDDIKEALDDALKISQK